MADTRWYDVTVPLHGGLARWPGSIGFTREEWTSPDGFVNSTLTLDPHTGTHIDAPRHGLVEGADVASIPLDDLVGLCDVVDLRGVARIEARHLAGLDLAPRVLFRTDNGATWPAASTFSEDYVALAVDAARELAVRGCRLVGIDHLSIQPFGGDPETHHALMRAGAVILEGLDLRDVPAGRYEILCLPLRLAGAEGAPARVLLRTTAGSDA